MTGKTVKRMIIMLAIAGVVLGAIFLFELVALPSIMKKVIASQANPPQTVSDTVAQKQDWQPQLSAIGSLRAVRFLGGQDKGLFDMFDVLGLRE